MPKTTQRSTRLSPTASGSTDPADDGDESGLLRTLVHATYWLDDGLQAYMRAHTGLSLPRAQSMTMVYLTEGVDRPSDLAEKLRVSKQAAQQALKELQSKDMIIVEQDPHNGRQKLVKLTEHGRAMQRVAKQGLLELESELAQRLGKRKVQALRSTLDLSWGPAPGCETQ